MATACFGPKFWLTLDMIWRRRNTIYSLEIFQRSRWLEFEYNPW
jgi:hypothetical protein